MAGWPIALDGSEGLACARVHGFLGSLQREDEMDYLPFVLWDERYTSAGARDVLEELATIGPGNSIAEAEPATRKWSTPRSSGKTSRRSNARARHRDKRAADSVAAALILGSFLAGGGAGGTPR